MKPILFFALTCAIIACSPRIITNNPTGVFFISSPAQDLVSLSATGSGKTLAKAEKDAIRRTFEAFLFQGIPNFTALSRPMVTSERDFFEKAPDFMDVFIQDRVYARFITSEFDPEIIDNRKGKRVSKKMTIHYGNFRRYLEGKKLIRKFGY